MAFEKPIWAQNNTYSARLDRQIIQALWTEGVIDGMKVKQRAAGAQMNVQIESGTFIIYGDDQAAQGAYYGVWTDDATVVTIAAAPGSNSRRDLVYVRVNDPNAGGPAGNNFTFGVVAGTPAASPTLPALPTSAIPLAEVLVTAGNIQVVNSMITTLRSPAQLKGAVPIGTVLDFSGPDTAVPSDFVLANAQAINRDTYWQYMAKVGTVHGAGDGTTTVNVPDLRGRVGVGHDTMGAGTAGRITGNPALGVGLGSESVALIEANLPPHLHAVAITTGLVSNDHTHGVNINTNSVSAGTPSLLLGSTGNVYAAGGAQNAMVYTGVGSTSWAQALPGHAHNVSGSTGGVSANHNHGVNGNTGNGNGTSTPVNRTQPSIIVNKIVKVR